MGFLLPSPFASLTATPIFMLLPPVPCPFVASVFHTTSLIHASVLEFVLSLVPAAATTYCEAAGQLGIGLGSPSLGHSSAPLSPVEIENVWPCATAVRK